MTRYQQRWLSCCRRSAEEIYTDASTYTTFRRDPRHDAPEFVVDDLRAALKKLPKHLRKRAEARVELLIEELEELIDE